MGNSSSRSVVENTNNQTFITETQVDIINRFTNTAVAEALIKSNNTCTSTNRIDQVIDFRKCHFGDNVNISGIGQKAILVVNFDCVNVFKAEQEMAQSLLSELMSSALNQMNTRSLNEMDNRAETQSKVSGIFGGNSSSDTSVNNTFNLRQVNSSYQNIQNVIANSINTNFEVESINNCIHNSTINQKQDFSECKFGNNITIKDIEQNADINSVIKCINKSDSVQNVINNVANVLDVVVTNETENDINNKIRNDIITKSDTEGLFGSCGSCPGCDNCSGICIWILVCLCIVLILGGAGFLYFKFKKSSV